MRYINGCLSLGHWIWTRRRLTWGEQSTWLEPMLGAIMNKASKAEATLWLPIDA